MSTATNDDAVDSVDNSSVDELISSRLNQISLEDRSLGLHDVHGVADLAQETTQMLQAKLQALNSALQQAGLNSSEDAQALQLAGAMSPDFVHRSKIMSLRAEEYDITLAAQRLLRYYTYKQELFGVSKLVTEIGLTDLTFEDIDALKHGVVQLLPRRDRAGRAVLFVDGRASSFYSTEIMMRVTFFAAMFALRDEETQMRGLVGIVYSIGQQQGTVSGRALEVTQKGWRAIPWRVVATHVCQDTSALNRPIRQFCGTLDNRSLCRLRIHRGSSSECLNNLLTFGIPKEDLPFANNGSINLAYHLQMLESIACREQESTLGLRRTARGLYEEIATSTQVAPQKLSPATIVVPGPMDVIMGRGRRSKLRPGSSRFHTLLVEHREAYDTASKADKIGVAARVLESMKESGCRFLKVTPDGFVQCDDATAKEKISHGFRNLRLPSTSPSPSFGDSPTTATGEKKGGSRKRSLPTVSGNQTESTAAKQKEAQVCHEVIQEKPAKTL